MLPGNRNCTAFARTEEGPSESGSSATLDRSSAESQSLKESRLLVRETDASEPNSKALQSLRQPGSGHHGSRHSENTKRLISDEMKRLQQNADHRRRISETMRGKRKVCSLCGEEGHNKRGCPYNSSSEPQKQGSKSGNGASRLSHAEIVALREKRREERRDRPKSVYKGLSWDARLQRWHVQVWTGSKVQNVGYFSDEVEGATAYDKAAIACRGPGVELNFPAPAQRVLGRFGATHDAVPLPDSSTSAVSLAVQSILEAWKAGSKRQRVEFLLTSDVNGEAASVQQEFKAARNLVEATLVQLKGHEAFAGPISAAWIDKTDCVGSWQSKALAAVVFCTADCVTQLRAMHTKGGADRLTLIFNPQWQIGGQIISDFGIGKGRRSAEDFALSFQETFSMQQRRIMGDNIQLLKCFSSKWQVHYIWPNGKGQTLISIEDQLPTYEKLLELLRSVPGSRSSKSWVERILSPEWISRSSRPPEGDAAPLASSIPSSAENGPSGSAVEAVVPVHAKKEGEPDVKKPALQGREPDRFAEARTLLDPVMQLPEWQRQMISNAFGRDRDDSAARRVRGPRSKRQEPRKKLRKSKQPDSQ